MPKLTQSVSKYRKHRASRQAVVSIGGRDYCLGPYGTKSRRIEYDRVIAEWLAGGRHPLLTGEDRAGITAAELIARYWGFVKTYYLKDGRPTNGQKLEWADSARDLMNLQYVEVEQDGKRFLLRSGRHLRSRLRRGGGGVAAHHPANRGSLTIPMRLASSRCPLVPRSNHVRASRVTTAS